MCEEMGVTAKQCPMKSVWQLPTRVAMNLLDSCFCSATVKGESKGEKVKGIKLSYLCLVSLIAHRSLSTM